MAQTLFNQPHSAQAADAWQPNAGQTKKLSSRGYATTRWTPDEPQSFATLGYPSKSSGFSAAHYQPTQQPLSQQALASLALLEDGHRNESLGDEQPVAIESSATNAHLPFVMDSFGGTNPSQLHVDVDPQVLTRALAHAELAETLVVSPITSDEPMTASVVIHPDDASPEEAAETPSAVAAEASEPEDQVAAEAPVMSAVVEAPPVPEPELPAVVGGIDPEEVAQREAEQFAKGLAQGREEAEAALADAVEKARAEALEMGIAQGKAEGLQQGLEQGKAEGWVQGEQTTREAVAEEMAAQRVLFESAATELTALMADPKKFFEPLKRLALHIAEQIVVGELQTSSQAMERLVQRCLDELDHPVQGAVVLELNPDDKALLQAQGGAFIEGMRLEAVHDMPRGSVRVFANDTVVEDLVQHRLEGLASALLVDVDKWREASPLVQHALEIEEPEDGDVHS